jgi:hypothetical protein
MRKLSMQADNHHWQMTGVAVEKLILGELRENSSREDALQSFFSDWVDIFYHRILGRL